MSALTSSAVKSAAAAGVMRKTTLKAMKKIEAIMRIGLFLPEHCDTRAVHVAEHSLARISGAPNAVGDLLRVADHGGSRSAHRFGDGNIDAPSPRVDGHRAFVRRCQLVFVYPFAGSN